MTKHCYITIKMHQNFISYTGTKLLVQRTVKQIFIEKELVFCDCF